MSQWSVEFHPACEKWVEGLEQTDAEALLAAVRVLRDQVPTLGRPLVGEEETMSLEQWEKKVLRAPGADQRVGEIEDELRLAAGLTALRESAGLSQRDLAERIGVSQPRIAAIECSDNVTISVLQRYARGVDGRLEVSVVQDQQRTTLL